MRCLRSPTPVIVGALATWPIARSAGTTSRQTQPPYQPPCIRTYVRGGARSWAKEASAFTNAVAPTALAINAVRRVNTGYLVMVLFQSFVGMEAMAGEIGVGNAVT